MKRTLAIVSALVIGVSQVATAGILIDYDAGNVGNGQLKVGGDGYSQGALLNETLPGAIFFNGDGRALAQYGNEGYNGGGVGTAANMSDITNNAAVQLDGFTIYRGSYTGGNNSFGTLETGTRLGATGNTAFNGHAFANSGEFFLFSDVYSQAITPSDTVSVSFQGGSDNGTADFSVYLLLDGATAGTQLGVNQTGNSTGSPRLTYSASGFTAASSVQLIIEANTADNSRSLVDNVFMEVVPEPATMGLFAVFGGAVLFVRRRFSM